MNTKTVQRQPVRSPIADGLLYPEDRTGVLAYMQAFAGIPGRGGTARAVIAPHGAWELSGSLAGAAFSAAAGRMPSRVVLLGPVHDGGDLGIFLSGSRYFQTPLGDLSVDRELSVRLVARDPLIRFYDIPHLHEHSIEVLLPFIRYLFPETAIVPILMGGRNPEHVGILAEALYAVFAEKVADTLFVVSMNLAPGRAGNGIAAGQYLGLFGAGDPERIKAAFAGGQPDGYGYGCACALLRSGLLEGCRPNLASERLLGAEEKDGTAVYYGAFSFV
ncbi:MAG: AmmeMemoRadiSam system protein B [Treponema sp.]|nr:AmmeMemoRadiSam system protein B [Treponema sp.]